MDNSEKSKFSFLDSAPVSEPVSEPASESASEPAKSPSKPRSAANASSGGSLRHRVLSGVRDPDARRALENYSEDDGTWPLATALAELTATHVGTIHADLQARLNTSFAQQDLDNIKTMLGSEIEKRVANGMHMNARNAIDEALEHNLMSWTRNVSKRLDQMAAGGGAGAGGSASHAAIEALEASISTLSKSVIRRLDALAEREEGVKVKAKEAASDPTMIVVLLVGMALGAIVARVV